MMERIGETLPRLEARIAGALHLLTILTGISAQGFKSGSLMVDGEAAATARPGSRVYSTCSPQMFKLQKSNLMFRRTHGTACYC
jgi:hypothetical protein